MNSNERQNTVSQPLRRQFLGGAALAGAAALAGTGRAAARAGEPALKKWEASYSGGPQDKPALPPGEAGRDYTPVVTPNGGSTPYRIVDGVKVFHLTVSEITHEFAPGLKAKAWAYNGRVGCNTIEAVEGERVRIYVTNRLPAPTVVHWHGIFLPCGMDGVSGLTQRPIPPGGTFKYEWTLRQYGTFMYHSHHDHMTQEGMGLTGAFIIHPRQPRPEERVDRDYLIMLNEWKIAPDTSRPDPNEMTDFNVLTMNGKAFPATQALLARSGERVRIRIGNLSAMSHHPIHLHGYRFKVVATDGERIPVSAQWPETTVLVAVGQTRELEFIADAPGDWAMHCHMTHHTMNQMGHGLRSMLGVKPGTLDARLQSLLPDYMSMGQTGMNEHLGHLQMGHMAQPANSAAMLGRPGPFGYIDMGGMFTLLKVRDRLDGDKDPGWYAHPPGTVAGPASAAELKRDGIALRGGQPPRA